MDQMKTLHFQLKAATLVLGAVIMGAGCHSYFKSEWNDRIGGGGLKLLCNGDPEHDIESDLATKCPSSAMESYFISITISLFILSFGNFFRSFFYEKDGLIKYLETGFHVLAGLLVFVGAVMNIYSANQIRKIAINLTDSTGSKNSLQLYDEKIVAGSLSLLNSCLYIAAGFYIFTFKDNAPKKSGRMPSV